MFNLNLLYEPSITLNYTGVDLNTIWSHIHNAIHQNENTSITTNFIYDDVFNMYDNDNENVEFNILILQYVLSHMVKYNPDGTDIYNFIDKLVCNIIDHMEKGSIIIINDINHINSRKYYDYMLTKLNELEIKYSYGCCHFNNDTRPTHFDYGEEYDNNAITINIPGYILANYNPWQSCSSAQLVVRKEE